MRALVLADLRHSMRIWGGSLVVLAVTQLCFMWIVGLLMVGITNWWMAGVDPTTVAPLVTASGEPLPAEIVNIIPTAIVSATNMSAVIVAIVASITVRNVVNAIVYQRRRVMAMWQLAGMTDGQLLRILRAQVALLSVVALAGAAVLALATVPWILDVLRAVGLLFTPLMTTWGIYIGYAFGAALGIVICIVAVRGASKELAAISPLEAIRSEGVRELPMTRRRWIGLTVWGTIWVALTIGTLFITDATAAIGSSLAVGVLGVVVLNIGGPVIIVGLVRAWTRIVPEHVSASWFLARKTLLAATARSVSTIGSTAIAVFLFTALFSLQTSRGGEADTANFVLVAGFALTISVAGSVVLVFMAGQQREREIQLAELAGATPAQQQRQALFEAVIVVVTGSGIGLALSVIMMAVTQPALVAETGTFALAISWGHFAGISLVLLVLNIIATVVPTTIAQSTRDRVAIVS